MANSFRNTLRQCIAFFWRFQTLRLADKIARESHPGQIFSRGFGPHRIYLDVSRSNVQRIIFLEGKNFMVDGELISSLLKPGMNVIDVGANIGYFMLLARETIGDSGSIVCFEPDADNINELTLNVERNALNNITISEAAVGSADGEVKLSAGLNSCVSQDGTRTVPVVKLDTALKVRADMMKIDVEGYEGHVLKGALETMKKCKPVLLLEMHPNLLVDFTEAEILEMVKAHYSKLEFYVIHEGAGFWAKFKHRYLGASAVRQIREDETKAYNKDKSSTYWVVAR